MNTLLDTLWYFCYITVELIVLFIAITAIVEIILMYIPQDKISKKIEKAGFFGNVMAAGFGALTPFCACSTLPMTVGFLNAGIPFGATMSFLIASPLLNPIIIAMLGALVGIKAMLIYVAIAFLCAVFFGWGLQKVDAQKYVKNVRLKKQSCCSAGEKPHHRCASVYSCRNCNPYRIGFDGQRNEYRRSDSTRHRRCRYGDTRNVNARKHLQEETCSYDSSSNIPDGCNLRVSFQYFTLRNEMVERLNVTLFFFHNKM